MMLIFSPTSARAEVPGKDGNYIRTQLKKRIEARGLNLDVSVVNNKAYLEK